MKVNVHSISLFYTRPLYVQSQPTYACSRSICICLQLTYKLFSVGLYMFTVEAYMFALLRLQWGSPPAAGTCKGVALHRPLHCSSVLAPLHCPLHCSLHCPPVLPHCTGNWLIDFISVKLFPLLRVSCDMLVPAITQICICYTYLQCYSYSHMYSICGSTWICSNT